MIWQGQRVFASGMTGEGKSQLLAHLFAVHTGQRLLIDVQDHYELGAEAREEGVVDVDKVSAIDWRVRTIRFVPRSGSPREYDELHRAIYSQRNLLVWCDEAEDVARVHRTPKWVWKTVKQGRKRRITYLAASQRPHGVERSVLNQAEHVFLFRMVDADDIQVFTHRIGTGARELGAELAALPRYGFVYHELGSEPKVMPPLPPEWIADAERVVRIPS